MQGRQNPTYEPSAPPPPPPDPYKHPITYAPVTKETGMNDNMLVIDDDDELPTTASAPRKHAKPHPESVSDANPKPTAGTMVNAQMKSSA